MFKYYGNKGRFRAEIRAVMPLRFDSSIKTSIDIYTTISEDLAKKNWSKAPTLFKLQDTKADTKEDKKGRK